MNHLARTPRQLGAIIQRHRRALKLTQNELGERASLRQATISQIEHGENARLESVLAVLGALDLELLVRERSRASASDIESAF